MASIKGIEVQSEIYDLEDSPARESAIEANRIASEANATATEVVSDLAQTDSLLDGVQTQANALEAVIGDIDTPLDTTAQTLIGAINEVNGKTDSAFETVKVHFSNVVASNGSPTSTAIYYPSSGFESGEQDITFKFSKSCFAFDMAWLSYFGQSIVQGMGNYEGTVRVRCNKSDFISAGGTETQWNQITSALYGKSGNTEVAVPISDIWIYDEPGLQFEIVTSPSVSATDASRSYIGIALTLRNSSFVSGTAYSARKTTCTFIF